MTYRILHTCLAAKPGDDGYQLDRNGFPAHIADLTIWRVNDVALGKQYAGNRCDGKLVIGLAEDGLDPVVDPPETWVTDGGTP